MKIGIIRETKTPPDKRVPFSPLQCKKLKEDFNLEVFVQPSPIRCFTDNEYLEEGIQLKEDLSDCDYLFGVKEVKLDALVSNKKYFFFSHTIKEQPYNKTLIKTLLSKEIQMIDYECLKNTKGQRLLGFGRYAGIVGSYNALLAWGLKTKTYTLKPAFLCLDMSEIKTELQKINLNPIKLILTGGGRVAHGAVELLKLAGIKQVSKEEYLNKTFPEAVFCNIDIEDYYFIEGKEFSHEHFYKNSRDYQVKFLPFLNKAEIFISCHYWDNESAVLFTKEDCKQKSFKTKVIADITCDIQGSVPTTLRSTTISDPLYDYNVESEKEIPALSPNGITIMAVDNLPCELPKDASTDFGNALIEKIIPELINGDENGVIDKASICLKGKLNQYYEYLKEYAR